MIKDSYLQWLPIEDYKLNEHEVHLWQIELPPSSYPARFEKLHSLKIKRREILIDILSKYLKRPINENDFELQASGKPYLKQHKIAFNTSHTRHVLLIALHQSLELGIDIEWMAKRSIKHFSQRFWGQEWYEKHLQPLNQYIQTIGFFQAWTGTEAWVKALGQTIFNHQEFPMTKFPAQAIFLHDDWQFKYFMPYPNFMASLCCSQKIKKVFLKKIIIRDLDDRTFPT